MYLCSHMPINSQCTSVTPKVRLHRGLDVYAIPSRNLETACTTAPQSVNSNTVVQVCGNDEYPSDYLRSCHDVGLTVCSLRLLINVAQAAIELHHLAQFTAVPRTGFTDDAQLCFFRQGNVTVRQKWQFEAGSARQDQRGVVFFHLEIMR